MLDSKLNTGAGVQEIKVPNQLLFSQENLVHTVAPSRTRQGCPPFYRPPCPPTEGDHDHCFDDKRVKLIEHEETMSLLSRHRDDIDKVLNKSIYPSKKKSSSPIDI